MVNYIKKYKYLIISTFAKLYLMVIFHNESSYIHCIYQLDFSFFNLVAGLGITTIDILYMVDYVLNSYNLKNQIIIRIHEKGYMWFVLKNMCHSLFIFVLTQMILQIIFYHHLTYHLFIYSLVLMVSNFIVFRFHHECYFNYLVVITLIINSFMKIFY